MSSQQKSTTLEIRGRVAIITINLPKQGNALDLGGYLEICIHLRAIAAMDDVKVTVLIGKGKYFSLGANFRSKRLESSDMNAHETFLRGFVANNVEVTHAFYSHPKILITALNGPAVGLSAAMTGWSDFIYAMPHAYILTPFSSIGLITEGGSSVSFVQRMGISKANEALIMSKRIPADELLACGYVNQIFDTNDDDEKFLKRVLEEVEDRLGEHLNQDSLVLIKRSIRAQFDTTNASQLVHEVIGGHGRFMAGAPQKEFARLASGEKKHKL